MTNATEQQAADDATDISADEIIMGGELAATATVPRLDASNAIHFDLMTRMGQLDEALLARDPMMKMHLGAIHKQLIQYEELVHLLTDEQIGHIVKAQQVHTGTVLAAEIKTPSGKAKLVARTAKLGMSDL